MKIFKLREKQIPRTLEGTLLEMLTALLLLAAWGVAFYALLRSSEENPFDGVVLITNAAATIISTWGLWSCYRYPERVFGHPYLETPRQQKLGVRLTRIIYVFMAALFLYLALWGTDLIDKDLVGRWPLYLLVAYYLACKFFLHRMK